MVRSQLRDPLFWLASRWQQYPWSHGSLVVWQLVLYFKMSLTVGILNSVTSSGITIEIGLTCISWPYQQHCRWIVSCNTTGRGISSRPIGYCKTMNQYEASTHHCQPLSHVVKSRIIIYVLWLSQHASLISHHYLIKPWLFRDQPMINHHQPYVMTVNGYESWWIL